ncbi:Uncharacterized protein conserved in bacteria [Kingella potus]|uniref:Uncharacterized protein conserved in bacteria n=3 Tax=Kingella potus TaxID=265175 RepID=A0A377R0F9_9NEIS|nr:Uncharacterized protein conserved in bacteria [Kingella potus]
MNLTFAVSLPEWPSEHLSAAPALAAMLRFGRFAAAPASSAAFYARTLWRGSLCRLLAAEAGLPDGTPCVLAAPVSQQMGMNQAHQACGRTLGITPDEAAAWCAGLTEFFADAGWRFHPCRPDLWLLSLPQQPGWQDVPSVWAADGQADGMERAEGLAPPDWLAAQTEIQMWLHTHPLNAARAVPVNGVWLWQDSVGTSPFDFTAADRSCAFLPDGRAAFAVPPDWDALQSLFAAQPQPVSDGLVFLEGSAAAESGRSLPEDWDRRFFAPALDALHGGRLKKLVLAAGGADGGSFVLTPYSRFAFWRRRRARPA